MHTDPESVLLAPCRREGIEFRLLREGSVHIGGAGLNAFILDEGRATVLEACDGRPLGEIVQGLRDRHGWEISKEEVKKVLTPLASMGYLEGTERPRRRPVRFDPEPLLRVLKPLHALYGRRSVAALAILLVVAGWVLTVWQGPRIVAALSDFRKINPPLALPGIILAYYLGYSVTAFFHELGHALAISRWGGEVPEIGIQRNANFYCLANRGILQTTDARLWYYGGGLLSDAVWWGLAWAWWLIAPGPVPLFLLAPQTVYFLVFAYAPSGNSDMAKILHAALGWKPLSRPGKGWLARWRTARAAQRIIESLRLLVAAFLAVYVGLQDVVLLLLYALYRLGRKGLNRI